MNISAEEEGKSLARGNASFVCAMPESSPPAVTAVPPVLAHPPGCHVAVLLPSWAEPPKGAHLIPAGLGGSPGLPSTGKGEEVAERFHEGWCWVSCWSKGNEFQCTRCDPVSLSFLFFHDKSNVSILIPYSFSHYLFL